MIADEVKIKNEFANDKENKKTKRFKSQMLE